LQAETAALAAAAAALPRPPVRGAAALARGERPTFVELASESRRGERLAELRFLLFGSRARAVRALRATSARRSL